MLSLSNLTKDPAAKKKKRRVGRGNASGKGNYSGRGMKGQRSRSGGKKKLALRGLKGYLLRIPKKRGFKSLKPSKEVVNIGVLDKIAQDNDQITPVYLLKKGLIKTTKKGVKILGEGKLKKKLIVRAHQFSKGAKDAIIKAGGKVEIIAKSQSTKNKQ
ncbi:50S ribosomal protein L15 [Patescibacteria group bacterium]|nr:50S ribosomal protein L15 [Patescibacteria group bacterium]